MSIGLVAGLVGVQIAMLISFWAIASASREDAVRERQACWGPTGRPVPGQN